jgi:Nucleosome assembly protein (NAP)
VAERKEREKGKRERKERKEREKGKREKKEKGKREREEREKGIPGFWLIVLDNCKMVVTCYTA